MRDALRVRQRFSEHHIPAAFAMNRTSFREMPQSLEEPMRPGKPTGVEFGIPPRQPASIAIVIRPLVGKWRKEADFGPGGPPTLAQDAAFSFLYPHLLQGWIEERECRILGQGEPLPRRCDRWAIRGVERYRSAA